MEAAIGPDDHAGRGDQRRVGLVAAIAVVLVGVSVASLLTLRSSTADANRKQQLHEQATQVLFTIREEEDALVHAITTSNASERLRFTQLDHEVDDGFAAIMKSASPATRQLADAAHAQLELLEALQDRALGGSDGVAILASEAYIVRRAALDAALGKLFVAAERSEAAATAERDGATNRILIIDLVGGVLTLLVAWAMATATRRRLRRERAAALEAQHAHAQLKRVLDTAADAYLELDHEGTVLAWNRRAEAIFGWTAIEAIGSPLAALIVPVERRTNYQVTVAALLSGDTVEFPNGTERDAVHRDGHTLTVEMSLWAAEAPDGSPRLHALLSDVSMRRAMQDELTTLAFTDPITHSPNRRALVDHLEATLRSRTRTKTERSLALIDIDRFKAINDALGHGTGDEVLREIADRLSLALRPDEMLARLGGDEFALVLHCGAEACGTRILDCFTEPVPVGGRELSVHASVGVATIPADGSTTTSALLRDADAALYAAKAAGRGQAMVFEPSMHTAALRRLELANELRGAADRGELSVHYQPLADVQSGTIVASEALVRWNHPQRGPVSPPEFVELAEETGFIATLGNWVLDEAVAQTA